MNMQATTQATIGSRIIAAREKAGVSQQELADLVRLSRNTIKNYENGNSSPTCVNLEGIAKSLSVEPAFLFSGHTHDEPDGFELTKTDTTDEAASEVKSSDTGKVDKLSDHLFQLSDMELDGQRLSKKKAEAHIKLIHVVADNMTIEEALEYAEEYDLANIDQISMPLDELLSDGLLEPSEGEVIRLQEQIINEVIERLIDKSIIGHDLYALDFEMLDQFSEDHDIYPNRMISFGWRGHNEMVPAIREKVREIALSGELPWEMEEVAPMCRTV